MKELAPISFEPGILEVLIIKHSAHREQDLNLSRIEALSMLNDIAQ